MNSMPLFCMGRPIPKWLQESYALLLKRFGENEFSFSSCKKVLRKDKEKIVSIALSQLRKAGWLEISRLDSEDSRKRYYRLRKLDEIFGDMFLV